MATTSQSRMQNHNLLQQRMYGSSTTSQNPVPAPFALIIGALASVSSQRNLYSLARNVLQPQTFGISEENDTLLDSAYKKCQRTHANVVSGQLYEVMSYIELFMTCQ